MASIFPICVLAKQPRHDITPFVPCNNGGGGREQMDNDPHRALHYNARPLTP